MIGEFSFSMFSNSKTDTVESEQDLYSVYLKAVLENVWCNIIFVLVFWFHES